MNTTSFLSKFSFFLLLISSLTYSNISLGKGFQFNFNVGTDDPESTDERSGSAFLMRFALSTPPKWIRLVTAFTAMTGGGLTQGEFALGPHFYVLSHIRNSPVQPFFFAEGSFGVGTYDDEVRTDGGFGIGVGVDMNFGDRGGMTLAVEQHNATESAHRLWLGFFYYSR